MKYATLYKKIGSVVLAALVMCSLVTLTACRKGEANPSPTEPTTTAETTEATAETVIEETEPTTENTSPVEETTPAETLVTMYVIKTVNYRTGPNTTFEKVGTLAKGSSVQVVQGSKTSDGWYKVNIDGNYYFVSAQYLSETMPSTDNGVTNNNHGSDSSSNGGTTDDGSSTPSTNTNTSSETFKGPADPSTGLSWDGVSPIIYTYTDGSTGTQPQTGATYEVVPGITSTYTDYVVGSNATGSVDGVFYCESCGKVCGDGSNGTCVNWLTAGNHTCSNCGETVPGGVCHTCDEN